MERDIPDRDTPGTFLFIHVSSTYVNFVPHNSMSFQRNMLHSQKKCHLCVHVFLNFLKGLFQVSSSCVLSYFSSSFRVFNVFLNICFNLLEVLVSFILNF